MPMHFRKLIKVDLSALHDENARLQFKIVVLKGEYIVSESFHAFAAFDDAEFWTGFDELISLGYCTGEVFGHIAHLARLTQQKLVAVKQRRLTHETESQGDV